jgi:hypothetical protein
MSMIGGFSYPAIGKLLFFFVEFPLSILCNVTLDDLFCRPIAHRSNHVLLVDARDCAGDVLRF